MFEKATRGKYRYDTAKGKINTEDLWDMPLSSPDGFSLDDLAKSLNRKLKASEEESFVQKKSNASSILDSKFSIVKRVIEVKLAQIEDNEATAVKKAKKDQILGILADKEEGSLRDKTPEELEKMLAKL